MSELNEMGCDQFGDMAAELALGVLTGRERAEAIAHLDRCEDCRKNVRQLTMTGEELLGLLPAREPPAGFETRVMDRLGMAAPRPGLITRIKQASRKRRTGRTVSRTRRILATAAVTLAVVISGMGGWVMHTATGPSATGPSATGPSAIGHPDDSLLSTVWLVSPSHQPVGQVFLYSGSPRWLYISVSIDSGKTGTVSCELVGRDRHVVILGKFRLNSSGYGAWGSPSPIEQGPFTGARLVGTNGTVLATASFSMT